MRTIVAAITAGVLTGPAIAQGNKPNPSDFSPEQLAERTLHRRAVEAAIWGMPIVSVDAMRQAFLRDAWAKYGNIVYFSKPADAKFQITTPNASSCYVNFAINTKGGPFPGYEGPPS